VALLMRGHQCAPRKSQAPPGQAVQDADVYLVGGNIAGVVSVAYTSGSPTVNGAQVAILQAAAQLFDARLRPPEAVSMAGRRW
jgi:hypothetical protein